MSTLRTGTILLAILGCVTPALASKTGVRAVSYYLVIDPDAAQRVQINLAGESRDPNDVIVAHDIRSPSVYVFEDFVIDSNGNNGWHYHPGIVLATVAEGAIDWYDVACVKHVRKTGDFFVENDRQIHYVVNSARAPARLILTFIVAKGQEYKVPVAAPPCAAAVGLQ